MSESASEQDREILAERARRVKSLAEGIRAQSEELYGLVAGHGGLSKTDGKSEEAEKTLRSAFPLESHKVGFLTIPSDIDELPQLTLGAGQRLISPNKIDLRSWNLAPKDQKGSPRCAAFAAASYAENILWRKNSYPQKVDPAWIYDDAKKIDGNPKSPGTSLVAVLQAMLNRGMFNPMHCTIKVLRTIEQVKLAIHKYGTCLIGVMVTGEYYLCNRNKHSVCGEGAQGFLGGHAIQCVGFQPDGLICRNSWGERFGYDGNFIIEWKQLERQFMYGATYDNPLYDFHMAD